MSFVVQEHVEVLKKGKTDRLRSAGLACVTLDSEEDKFSCCRKLDGKELFGRPMGVKLHKFE